VIALAENIKIVMNDKTEYDVEVIRVSKIHDLVLLKIEKPDAVPFKISESKEIEIASDIFAVGSPRAEDLSQSVSKGIISGKRQTDQGFYLMQIDASVNSGNSGGAIVSQEGLVLGVVSSKLFGFGIEGIGFGIPAYEILDRLKLNY
jgi:S1-C subfamily serine protease